MSTVQLSDTPESRKLLEDVMQLFGTRSRAAAIRSSIALALIMMKTAKDDTLLVKDQHDGSWMKIRLAS